jgi:hypothetical protein
MNWLKETARIQASRKHTFCSYSTKDATSNTPVQKIAWTWMSQKPPKATRKEGFATSVNSQGTSEGTVKRGWPRKPKGGSHKYRHDKLRWLTKKKKTPLPR